MNEYTNKINEEVVFIKVKLKDLYLSGKEIGKPIYSQEVVKAFIKKVDILMAVSNSIELSFFRSLHLEAFVKEKKYRGMHSIRVNDKYRLILKIIKSKDPSIRDRVELLEIHDLTDYH